jgi:hypothetical protein
MANRIIPMILIVEVFTHKCFDDNYHKIAYTSKHINIVEISFYNRTRDGAGQRRGAVTVDGVCGVVECGESVQSGTCEDCEGRACG